MVDSMSDTAAATRLAVIGAGGIGGFTAALAQLAGHDVTLCVRTPIDKLAVETGGEVLHSPVRIATRPERESPADWVLVTTKAQDTGSAAEWLRRLVGPHTRVAVLQNGVGHVERVAPLLPEGTEVLPVLVYISAERTAPGRITHHVGNVMLVPEGGLADRFASLFDGSGIEVRTTADFTTAAWRKLFSNLAANPLTALTERRVDVFAEPDMARLASDVLGEAVAVARAEGAEIGERDVRDTLDLYAMNPAAGGTSMLYDRLAGRPLEHEHITGVVVRAGERHGIPTPLNTALLTLLRALDHSIR
jgi:2-dehydropantoate 2-reductase